MPLLMQKGELVYADCNRNEFAKWSDLEPIMW